jgi:ribosome-associated protein
LTQVSPATAPSGSETPHASVDALHALVMHQLDEDQAQEPVTIALAGKSSIADHMVIATGRSTRHVAAMAEKLAQRIKQELGRSVRIEGLPNADWVLLDAGDVVIHLFRPEVRGFYNLERMWSFGDAPAAPAAAAN